MSVEFSQDRYEALAEFRYQVRRFLRFSDEAARQAELEPQQHQMLLAIKGSPTGRLTIGGLAERLQIRHHSAVELSARAEAKNLLARQRGTEDQRQVFVQLTDAGTQALHELSAVHHRELLTAAPELIRVLQRIVDEDSAAH